MKTITLFLIMLLTTIVTTTQVCGNVVIELPELDRTWRPGAEPTLTKQDHTNTASFALKIKNLPYDYNKIDIKLINVSKWQGICGNYPLSGAKKDRDLKFIKSKNTKWKYENDSHLSYKTSTQSREKTVEGTVNVTAYDYAAYGKLEVSVRTRTWKVGPFEGYADPSITKDVTIPLDENGNQIADGWNGDDDEDREYVINGVTKKGWNPSADDENVLNTNNGDGYSVFDEYRGFWTGTNHIELSPTAKDAIICPEDDDGDINTTTTRDMWWYEDGAASAIPSHSFHIIHQTHVKDPFRYKKVFYDDGTMRASVNANNGWVNVNSKKIPGYKQAWAIRIGKRTFDPTENPTLVVNGLEIYETFGNAAVGPPSQHSLIRIFYSAIRGYVYYKKRTFDTDIIDALTKNTIAHEIGHTVHLKHCSVPWSKTNNCIMQQQSSNVTDVKTAFGGHADGSHEIDYALTGSPPPPTAPHPTQGEGSEAEVTVDLSPCNSCTTGDVLNVLLRGLVDIPIRQVMQVHTFGARLLVAIHHMRVIHVKLVQTTAQQSQVGVAHFMNVNRIPPIHVVIPIRMPTRHTTFTNQVARQRTQMAILARLQTSMHVSRILTYIQHRPFPVVVQDVHRR